MPGSPLPSGSLARYIRCVDTSPDTASFIARWQNSGAAERANYQLFLSELCDLLGVARPDPTKPDDADNAYVFERSVTFHHPDGSTSTGRVDLYKRGCYVLEAKQGVEKREAAEALADATKAKAKAAKKGHAQRGSAAWDEAMLKARGQAEQYARALPASEGRPPLLIVVDVGHSIELYSEFTRTGGTYVPFPDPQSHRLLLARLSDADVRETLRLAWTDPQALDPARRSARVTREIAQSLGRLAASLEKSGHSAEAVATFLMRALFTMFAEDVELLPKDSFINLLKSLHGHTDQFVPMIEELWGRMKTGGFSTVLREKVRHFNGGLFESATALPLTDDQFELLIEASRANWRDVEPAIFGTLLERALNPIERHKLGAHRPCQTNRICPYGNHARSKASREPDSRRVFCRHRLDAHRTRTSRMARDLGQRHRPREATNVSRPLWKRRCALRAGGCASLGCRRHPHRHACHCFIPLQRPLTRRRSPGTCWRTLGSLLGLH